MLLSIKQTRDSRGMAYAIASIDCERLPNGPTPGWREHTPPAAGASEDPRKDPRQKFPAEPQGPSLLISPLSYPLDDLGRQQLPRSAISLKAELVELSSACSRPSPQR
jgi:hypothetical protein